MDVGAFLAVWLFFIWESAFTNTRARRFHPPLRRQTKVKEGTLSSRNTSECDGTSIAYEADSGKMAFRNILIFEESIPKKESGTEQGR